MQYNFVNMSSVFNLYAVILYLYRLFGSIVDRMESCRTDLQWSKVWTIITLWRAIAWSPACLSVHHISWMLCNKYSRRPINNLASSLNLLSTLAECLSATRNSILWNNEHGCLHTTQEPYIDNPTNWLLLHSWRIEQVSAELVAEECEMIYMSGKWQWEILLCLSPKQEYTLKFIT